MLHCHVHFQHCHSNPHLPVGCTGTRYSGLTWYILKFVWFLAICDVIDEYTLYVLLQFSCGHIKDSSFRMCVPKCPTKSLTVLQGCDLWQCGQIKIVHADILYFVEHGKNSRVFLKCGLWKRKTSWRCYSILLFHYIKIWIPSVD